MHALHDIQILVEGFIDILAHQCIFTAYYGPENCQEGHDYYVDVVLGRV